MDKVNEILVELGVSKVKLARYLGVSRQMIYNYLSMNSINEWPKEKSTKFLGLLGVKEEKDIAKIELDSDFILAVEAKLADGEKIKGVTDHDYVTNSYHVNPHEKIDAFAKLKLEGEYLSFSKGGAVSYIECGSSLVDNKKVILQLFKFMYDNILYSELNFRNEGNCDECGYEGELNIVDENGKLLFECPHCHTRNEKKLHYTLRICGYIGEVANGISENSPNSNQGRIADFKDRVINIG